MAKTIVCECGNVIEGRDDDELVKKFRKHLREAHPKSKMSRDRILGMATEVS